MPTDLRIDAVNHPGVLAAIAAALGWRRSTSRAIAARRPAAVA